MSDSFHSNISLRNYDKKEKVNNDPLPTKTLPNMDRNIVNNSFLTHRFR